MLNKFYISLTYGKEAGNHQKKLNMTCTIAEGNHTNCQEEITFLFRNKREIKNSGEKSAVRKKITN